MEKSRIAELLEPFIGAAAVLSPLQLEQISKYIDLLRRWNARVNLTAIRDAEEVVTRHFGESLFAAQHLPGGESLVDVGSGAGFPGSAIKIWRPELRVTLIESNQKKATFLREVVRALGLGNVEVFAGRAEKFGGEADIVTLRAVERFEDVLPQAVRLVTAKGTVALLIGEAQVEAAHRLAPGMEWKEAVDVPLSKSRKLVTGVKA